jgi:leucine-rich repeat protein SHOC2
MDKLESLWLQRNHVFDLPSDLGDMKGLKQLCAYGNHIKALPDSCSGLTSLVTLALNDNGIGPLLPESMFGMSSLVSLDLSDNVIETLPIRFGELINLKHFWCSRNKIESLPASIGSMTQLESLHLHENKLALLPPNVGGWSNLKVLTLARNKLEHLPPTFRLLVSLQRLTLDHNTTMTYMAEDGKFFQYFICLSAMSIDKSVFKLIDEEMKAWCKSHISNLKVMNTPTSKAKLRAQLLEASGFKMGVQRHAAHL